MFHEQSSKLLPLSVGHSDEARATKSQSFSVGVRVGDLVCTEPEQTNLKTSKLPQLLISKFESPFGSGLSASQRSPLSMFNEQSGKLLPLSVGHWDEVKATKLQLG